MKGNMKMICFALMFGLCLASFEIIRPVSLRQSIAGGNAYQGQLDAPFVCRPTHFQKSLQNIALTKPQNDNLNGCSNINFSTENEPENSYILLLENGDCELSQKIKNAISVGASGIILLTNDNTKERPICPPER